MDKDIETQKQPHIYIQQSIKHYRICYTCTYMCIGNCIYILYGHINSIVNKVNVMMKKIKQYNRTLQCVQSEMCPVQHLPQHTASVEAALVRPGPELAASEHGLVSHRLLWDQGSEICQKTRIYKVMWFGKQTCIN